METLPKQNPNYVKWNTQDAQTRCKTEKLVLWDKLEHSQSLIVSTQPNSPRIKEKERGILKL